MTQAAPIEFLPPEEMARANFYALIARLFYAPPDSALLKAIATEKLEGEGIAAAWSELAQAAATADPEDVRDEYDTVFVGTGKAQVTPYTCAYSIRYSNEAPLVDLRGELARLGLGRKAEANEPEDHIAALCDAMRHLVAEQKRSLEEQKRFFERWIGPTFGPLCAAIERNDKTRFYKSVAKFAKSFFELEQTGFELL
ncbi:MAG TPA: molecular chaperone TorD family protein [Burkholderiales bacterium]|nr:molecular chaperone TorD family protein [Burkholderiales bacterium]